MEILPKDTALLIKITHSQPIEVKDFVATMNSIGNLFDDFCKENGDSADARKAKLYVEKIEHGSIEIFLTEAVTALALPYIENINLIMEFAGHIKNVIQYFTQGKGDKPKLTQRELKNYKDVFAITAGDNKGKTEIGAIETGNKENIFNNCTFNYFESNAAQNQIERAEKELKDSEPSEKIYERQLMTIFQMRGNMGTDTGNRAIVDNLSSKSFPVVFETDELKREILNNDENPTKKGFLVDVIIQTIGGKPAVYKIIRLHEIISLDD